MNQVKFDLMTKIHNDVSRTVLDAFNLLNSIGEGHAGLNLLQSSMTPAIELLCKKYKPEDVIGMVAMIVITVEMAKTGKPFVDDGSFGKAVSALIADSVREALR